MNETRYVFEGGDPNASLAVLLTSITAPRSPVFICLSATSSTWYSCAPGCRTDFRSRRQPAQSTVIYYGIEKQHWQFRAYWKYYDFPRPSRWSSSRRPRAATRGDARPVMGSGSVYPNSWPERQSRKHVGPTAWHAAASICTQDIDTDTVPKQWRHWRAATVRSAAFPKLAASDSVFDSSWGRTISALWPWWSRCWTRWSTGVSCAWPWHTRWAKQAYARSVQACFWRVTESTI